MGEDVAGIWDAPELYKKLDASVVQDAAKTYLGADYVKVVLMPAR